MAELVETVEQVIANLITLNQFGSGSKIERRFHDKRIKNGKLFVTLRRGGDVLFAPSKYAGYRDNDVSHQDDLDNRDGRITNRTISALLGPPLQEDGDLYKSVDRGFLSYCKRHRIVPSVYPRARRYWLIDEFVSPDEIQVDSLYEGALLTVRVNRYERNAAARRACLAHYGYDCSVCGTNLGDRYGSVGENFIHVHHIVPLSKIERTYKVDPVRDLRPMCPNCHAIIHRNDEPIAIEALKALMRSAKV
jgi:5-methylcytosine-specific restriction protein A